MKYNPITWKMEEANDSQNSVIECRGFYNSEKELKTIKFPKRWNFAIVTWDIQHTFEFDGDEWKDSWCLYMPTGKPGQNAEPAVSINKAEIVNGKLVIWFTDGQEAIIWTVVWKDAEQITVTDIINDLKNDVEFLGKVKGKDWVWEDGKSVSLAEVVAALKKDPEFINQSKWKDWEDGNTPVIDTDYIVSQLKNDKEFQELVRWLPWEKGEDAVVDTKQLAKDLKNDKEFIGLTKWDSVKWDDGTSVTKEEVAEYLMSTKSFIEKVKGKDWLDCTITTQQIVKAIKSDTAFVESIKGRDWQWFQWAPWRDGDSINVWFSPNWSTNITAEYKEWDKFIHIAVWNRRPNTIQIVK